jgi:predicted ferric reductase
MFWLCLATGLWLWWRDTPAGSVDSAAGGLEEAGRITGLVGGYALLVQILMMSRVGWLERHIGANELLAWHRDLGALLVVMVLGHAALLVFAYSSYDGKSVVAETWSVLTTYEDMVSAFVATGILVGVGLLAIRAVRAIMPYELWYYLHLTTYAVLVLSYGHQFATGRDLADRSPGRVYWIGLYVVVLAALGWGRVLSPIAFNLRHRLRVAEVVDEGGQDMFSIYIEGHRLDEIRVRAGQFFRWRFLTFGCWWQAHPFSLSAAPNGRWLRLTIKAVGGHTGQLRGLEPGVRIFAEGPSGVFTADRRTRRRALLIAGGSGIAPIRALLEDLPRGTVVIYRASSADDLIFREELDWLADNRDAEVFYIVGKRDDPGPRWVLSPSGLRDLVPDLARRDVFLCGPTGLVAAATDALRKLRIPRRQIHLDPFEF